jgi:hypothetical protein
MYFIGSAFASAAAEIAAARAEVAAAGRQFVLAASAAEFALAPVNS